MDTDIEEYELHARSYEDEFEREFADEMEMAESMEPGSKTAASRSSDRCDGMSRRNLSMTSPFQSGDMSRKRPMDSEEPTQNSSKLPRLEDTADTPPQTDIKTSSRKGLTTLPPSTHSTPSTLDEDTPSTPTHTSFKRSQEPKDDKSYAKMATTTFQSAYQQQPEVHTPTQDKTGKYRRLHVLSRAPAGPYMTVTGSNGTRVYLRMGKGQGSTLQKSFVTSQLLSAPVTELIERVEEEKREKLITDSNLLLQALQEKDDEDSSQELFEGAESGHMLWVDKYSPHNYTDLLSDDGINRTLLSWLRLWDEVVFNRPVPLKTTATATKHGGGGVARGGGSGRGKEMFRGKFKNFEKRMEVQDPSTFAGQEALDDSRRPRMKLALLCGAPGLGKTTLAHVIASHAGYNVVEMNASDDRSPDVFKQRIEAATQMQAVLTDTTKPNCLIIDEIDGAPTAAINVLIDYVTKTTKVSGKKKGDVSNLSRPIVCICNDQYAPSLRQLRQHTLLLNFPPIVTSRLASRLYQVTRREQLTATMSTLIALCEKTINDIRSCLNTIQFIGRKSTDISLGSVQTVSIGQKDAQRNLFSFWKEVFQLPTSKKHTLNQGPLRMSTAGGSGSHDSSTGHLSTNAGRFHHILTAGYATGESDKVANGLFENYLLARVRDPNLEAISVAQDWLVFNDTLSSHIGRCQDYMFMAYLPFLAVAFHFLFAASTKTHLKYPNTGYEIFLRTQRNERLTSSLLLETTPTVRCSINHTLLVTEILSPLAEIIAPSFRPVSTQLYSAQEKQQLLDLVGTMISYNLTYRQERGVDGQYTYVLDPNIEELCRFPGLPQRKQLSYSAKQLISREVDMEKMRRAEKLLNSKQRGPSDERVIDKPPILQLAQTKPATKKISEEKTPVDFFGRPLTPSSRVKGTAGWRASGGGANLTHPLWFKFNEGYSNAVRRPIKIKTLL
ncbi:chromosome transmission fidelity protein 18 homolog isoform X2 [Halichondria panicea]|uniref:chromosome transmission fidelity protein 18 homolog isoform X2 n=1 Tax=Halichondria panicea TaxID=6063 RepID=UPI00312B377D